MGLFYADSQNSSEFCCIYNNGVPSRSFMRLISVTSVEWKSIYENLCHYIKIID